MRWYVRVFYNVNAFISPFRRLKVTRESSELLIRLDSGQCFGVHIDGDYWRYESKGERNARPFILISYMLHRCSVIVGGRNLHVADLFPGHVIGDKDLRLARTSC